MKKCALLTMDSLANFFAYDQLLIEPLAQQGWIADLVSWRSTSVQWADYDVVIIRSTWDYQSDVQAFLQCLVKIEASGARLENSLKLVKWNISKTYLKDMQNQGINIVPTLWFEAFDLAKIQQGFMYFDTEQIVIKPLVSANADDTFRLSVEQLLAAESTLHHLFNQRPFMLQPFLSAIVEEGEFSLFYFAGHYSHAILKQPKHGDFRVQEEHGGQLKTIEPDEAMLTSARHALASLPGDALYARVDLVRYQGEFALMEVELIEPSLYFNMDPASPQRFVNAFIECYGVG
ncbi:ATP-grasp domain-containing protein [Flavobacterium sp. W21_SRS_FM6]|uniref:ATP-grasp domain-containing protein n=1 Tax=Flavobacterium sp. W21_SRS_FM6 TaxID=3240268 RepID=UPI003F913B4D